MPGTRRQTRFLLSSGSPLTAEQKDKMKAELHQNPQMGEVKKGLLHRAMERLSNTR